MTLTIFRKGLILVGIPFLFQLLLIFLFVEMHDRNAKNQNWFLNSKEILAQAQSALRLMVDAEAGIRGYMATDDESFTESYERALKQLPGALRALQGLVAGDVEQATRLQALEVKVDDILKAHAEQMQLMRNGAKAVATSKMAAGKKDMDALRGDFDEFLAAEKRSEIGRKAASDKARSDSYSLAMIGAALAVASAILLVVAFSRGVSGRLGVLTENAERFAEGKELLPLSKGSDEIAQLDFAFRAMERKVADSRTTLAEQRHLLQSVLESMGDGVLACDENGKLLVWNPAAERIIDIGAVASRPDDWTKTYGVFLPDAVTPLAADENPLMRALRGEAPEHVELFIRNARLPDGVFITVNARPLHDDRGHLRGGVAVFHDVSEKRRAEQAIRHMNEELERRVRERTLELVEVNRDLAQQSQENEMFVYSVSHDLRSPLVNLQGFSKELEKGCEALAALLGDETMPEGVKTQSKALLSGKMAKSLGFIRTAVLRLASIIDALLRLSRAGRVEYRWESVDLDKLVARIVASVHGTIQERGATVTASPLPPVRGDVAAIEQIFGNLIVNALTYLDPARPGAIHIGSAATPPPNTADGLRVYYVKDNGLGIAEGHRQKIFQIFQRAHPGVGKGEGMGLAIVQRVVERHGGRIWVESDEGRGSTFYLTLPTAN
jgi:signal transduction histidine kinase/CHASE3 domain sensor protein